MAAFESRTRTPAPEPGLYPNVPMEEYLAWDAWSASDVRRVAESPDAAWHAFNFTKPSTDAQTKGTLAHMLLLEPKEFDEFPLKVIEGPFNKNPGKKDRTAAIAAGFTVISPQAYEDINGILEAVTTHPVMNQLFLESAGQVEVVAIWICPHSHLKLKARCDRMVPDARMIGDLKTTELAGKVEFSNAMWNYGYWSSAAHYLEGFSAVDEVDYASFIYAQVQSVQPYTPRCFEIEPSLLQLGGSANLKWRKIVQQCLTTGEWGHGFKDIEPASLSGYRYGQIEEMVK